MKIFKHLNRLFLFANLWFGLVLIYMMSNRSFYEPISKQLYPDSDYLMGSFLVDLLIRKEAIFVMVVIMLLVWLKERKLGEDFKTRLLANIAISVLFGLLGGVLVANLYA